VPFFPALLALESLGALALCWGLYHRISRTRLGEQLAPLRDFTFTDHLVWGLIAGIVLFVLPVPDAWRGTGANLLVFFGALYAVRGLAVLAWYLEASRAGAPPVGLPRPLLEKPFEFEQVLSLMREAMKREPLGVTS